MLLYFKYKSKSYVWRVWNWKFKTFKMGQNEDYMCFWIVFTAIISNLKKPLKTLSQCRLPYSRICRLLFFNNLESSIFNYHRSIFNLLFYILQYALTQSLDPYYFAFNLYIISIKDSLLRPSKIFNCEI